MENKMKANLPQIEQERLIQGIKEIIKSELEK